MKRIFRFLFAVAMFATMISCSKFDDTAIWQAINKHSEEIASLKERCNKFNSDLVSLQQLVGALQGADYITNCTPLADGSGYTIIFKSGKSIVINHGKDGTTPQIGIEKDTDDLYYWTMDGEWLLDKDGNKIKAGGVDGKDGVAPQLKIQDGDWYLSTDGGQKWTKLGKATGEDGKSLFTSVTPGDNYVSFVLSNGTELKVPYFSGGNDVAITGEVLEIGSTSVIVCGYCHQSEEDGMPVIFGIEYSASDLTTAAKTITARHKEQDGKFSCQIKYLRPNTTYYYRAYVLFNGIRTYGIVKTFKTQVGDIEEIVDLGLSVKWRGWNLGAFMPEDYGGYYQWGGLEDITKVGISPNLENCPYHMGSDYFTGWTKYVPKDKATYWAGAGSPDNKLELDIEDDVAHYELGDKWRIPTWKEIEELRSNCTWEDVFVNGVRCYKVTSKKEGYTNKYIYLPMGGFILSDGNHAIGTHCFYLSSTLSEYPSAPKTLIIGDIYSSGGRDIGIPIRPVYDCSMPDMIDLGLSVKWSSWNLGASKPEEYGGYYQWAGTQDVTNTSIELNWANCPYHMESSASSGWLKYITSSKSSYWSGAGSPDNQTVLDLEDDAVHSKLGEKWRMPTSEEWKELLDNCTAEWSTLNGVKGNYFTSKKNGNRIFLPAAGYRNGCQLINTEPTGLYWTSSLYEEYPQHSYGFVFGKITAQQTLLDEYRYYGLSMRPVSD